jgi:hypothetical protein
VSKFLFKRSIGNRESISRDALQEAIRAGVMKADPSCESFIGVIVERLNPKSNEEPNWAVKGVRYGRADRDKAHVALTTIVERLQREFRLSDARPMTRQG